MTKKLWTVLSILLIAVLALAACTPAATPTPDEPATGGEGGEAMDLSGTITIWHALKELEAEAFNGVVASFQEAYPDVTFDILYVPDTDLRGKFETAAATGGGPTMLVGFADWGPAFYDASLVADLSGMASADFLAGINQAALDSVEYNSALVGLPLGIKGVVMYRNTSIVPEAPTSVDDLIAKAQAATQGDVVGAYLERGPFFVFGHLHAQGGQLMTAEGDPAFNTDAGVAWLTMLNSFTEAGPAEFNADNDVNLFKAGKAGIIIDGTWNLQSLAESIGEDNLKVDPWPVGLAGYVQNDNLYMSANAEGANKDATWAFMQYVLSQEAQAEVAAINIGFFPAALGVDVPDRLRQEVVTAFGAGVAFPVIPEMNAYWGPMETALKTVFDEAGDPAASLATAEESVNAAIVEIRGGQ
jgi:arabinogalactan oligomer / maltooligosaccharide transport system substrate-binding protein